MRVLQRPIRDGMVLQPGWTARQIVIHNPTTRQVLVRVGGTDRPTSRNADLVIPAYTTQSVPVDSDTFAFAVSGSTILSVIPEAAATVTLYDEPVPSSFGSVSQVSYPLELLAVPGFPKTLVFTPSSSAQYVDISLPGAASARITWSCVLSGGTHVSWAIPSVVLMPVIGGGPLFMASGPSGTLVTPLDASGNVRLWIANPFYADFNMTFFSKLDVFLHVTAAGAAPFPLAPSRAYSAQFTFNQTMTARLPLIGRPALLTLSGPQSASSYSWTVAVIVYGVGLTNTGSSPPLIASYIAKSHTRSIPARVVQSGYWRLRETWRIDTPHGYVAVDISTGDTSLKIATFEIVEA
jgi:hypothetical protein